MHSTYCSPRAVLALVGAAFSTAALAAQAPEGRRIEEVIVTAEKREATVSDTSISITAFGEAQIQEFGIQGADEMVNFIPATTRDAYDIRIRGVGRNFRALGGDPGVATYYNGVYSEDFGIASSEAALYDVARIEALRGPQGTLYGRNAIGGALNYITNKPSYQMEGELRTLVGNYDTTEFYGILSGPLIKDTLAYRLVGVRRDRDPWQEGIEGSEDTDSTGDQNLSVALNWRISDNVEANVRWNDRAADQIFGQSALVSEGPTPLRGIRSSDIYAYGLRPVPAGYVGPTLDFGGVSAIYNRPGFDSADGNRPNAGYGGAPDVFDSDLKDLEGYSLNNNRNDVQFDHNAVQADLTWDINDTTSIKYIGGWMEFDYTFFDDFDNSASTLTQYHQKVLEAVETHSHELQLLWQLGDNLQLTSGVYYFNADRRQVYSVNDDAAQGRYVNPVNYGPLQAALAAALGEHKYLGSQQPGTFALGIWEGHDEGQIYGIDNRVETDALAVYTQGTYTFNENWALTLGIRWAEDEKTALEQRGAYVEDNPDDPSAFGALVPVYDGVCVNAYGVPCAAVGLSYLAVMNMLMGNASFVPTFNPANPITPTCALDDPDCATPLRLQGLPYSYADAGTGKRKWNDVTWRVNIDWTPTDNSLIYLSATTGYRSGGYSLGLLDTRLRDSNSGTVGEPFSYDQEEVIAYELGYKGTLLDGRMQLFTALYHYGYDNYQDEVEAFNPTTGDGQNVVINAPTAENMGWEIETTWLATDAWTLGGNYSYTRTKYTSDVFVVEDDDPSRPGALFTDEELTVNLNGNDLKRIPRHKASLFSSYDFVFDPGVLSLGATFSYTGEYYDSGIERSLDEVPSRTRTDLYVSWRDNADRWLVRAFVDNVTDEGANRGIGTATAGGNWRQTATLLEPRFYGVDVTYRLR